jgi:lipoate-protein ligase A
MTSPLRILDTGLAPARWNVAMTAALVDGHADGVTPDTVRFHRYRPCVLLGNSQSPTSAADLDYCRRHDIEIARRVTGGGAVFMSPRMLAWDVIIPLKSAGTDLDAVARQICTAIAAGLSRLGVLARFRVPNDIEIDGLKVSGSSGYVQGRSADLQGTVLIEDDIPTMAAALRIPETGLRHKISCLASTLGAIPAIELLQNRIAAELAAFLGRTLREESPRDDELRAAEQRFRSEIGTDDYVLREPPSATARTSA